MKETIMNFGSRLDTVFRSFCSLGLVLGALALGLPTASCSDDSSGGGGAGGENALGGAGGAADAFPGCSKGELEADFLEDTPLVGPGVDQDTGVLAEGSYFIAATYLAMEPGVLDRVMELSGPTINTLVASEGFVAMSTARSESCLSLRTLTVWESEEAMFEFVASPAHSAAMSEMSELSRGSSSTLSWQGSAADASWEVALEKLGAGAGADK
jgi:heme-degrading monooxygenase HmoA